MLALTVAATVGSWVLRGGAAFRVVFLSTMPTITPTFARLNSVSKTVAFVALCESVVFNEELIVIKLSVMEYTLLPHDVSLSITRHL